MMMRRRDDAAWSPCDAGAAGWPLILAGFRRQGTHRRFIVDADMNALMMLLGSFRRAGFSLFQHARFSTDHCIVKCACLPRL